MSNYLKKLKFIFCKNALISDKQNLSAIHECSHIVIANHFNDSLLIEFVTLNKTKIKEFLIKNDMDPNMNLPGLCHIVPKKIDDDDFKKNYMKVYWSSIIAENIFRLGHEKFYFKKDEYYSNLIKMDKRKFYDSSVGGDFESIDSLGRVLFPRLKDRKENERNDIEFALNFFEIGKNWENVVKLADELLANCNVTLNNEDIQRIIN